MENPAGPANLPHSVPRVEEGLPKVLALLEVMLQEAHRQATNIALMHRDLQEMASQLTSLARILRDDGQASLIVRTALLEKQISTVTSDIASMKQSSESRDMQQDQGRADLNKAIIASGLAFVAGVLVAILSALFRHP